MKTADRMDIMGQINSTTLVRYFKYLDNLRDSGRTNMWAAGLWLERNFGLGSEKSSEIAALWMKTFDEDKSAAERVAIAARPMTTAKRD